MKIRILTLGNMGEKTIFITGGTGFIGGAICAALTDLGAKVIVLTRKRPDPRPNISFIQSFSQMGDRDLDVVINLAGEPIAQRWTPKTKSKIQKSRIDTTSLLMDFIGGLSKKPSLLISGSATGYYGTDPHNEFIETLPPAAGGPFSRSLCAAWESKARQAEQYGIRTVLLRIGPVLAKDGGLLGKMLHLFRLGLGSPIGHGRQWLSWIDRDDLIRLVIHIINTPSLKGPLNGTAPHPVENHIFAQTLGSVLKKPCFLRTPAVVLRTVLGEMADEIMLEGQKVLPKKALESGFIFSYPDLKGSLEKILKTKGDLG